MSWQTRKIYDPTNTVLKVGDWWHCPWYVEKFQHPQAGDHPILSPEYIRDWLGQRDPIVIVCPGGHHWLIDGYTHYNGNRGKGGWTITGSDGLWTASPSIHFEGTYHGWLRDGVLSDDVDGRTFT